MSEANKPAFPVPNDANVNGQEGLTKRDYIAACVLPAIIQSAANDATRYMDRTSNGFPIDRSGYTKTALQYADAMLSETERHNDLLALVEEVATLTKDDGEKVPRLNTLTLEARRILGRSE